MSKELQYSQWGLPSESGLDEGIVLAVYLRFFRNEPENQYYQSLLRK